VQCVEIRPYRADQLSGAADAAVSRSRAGPCELLAALKPESAPASWIGGADHDCAGNTALPAGSNDDPRFDPVQAKEAASVVVSGAALDNTLSNEPGVVSLP
jgi:hypothetical protein